MVRLWLNNEEFLSTGIFFFFSRSGMRQSPITCSMFYVFPPPPPRHALRGQRGGVFTGITRLWDSQGWCCSPDRTIVEPSLEGAVCWRSTLLHVALLLGVLTFSAGCYWLILSRIPSRTEAEWARTKAGAWYQWRDEFRPGMLRQQAGGESVDPD